MEVDCIRKDYPALSQRRNGLPVIYFDNACMPLRPQPVIDALIEYYTCFPACGGAGRSGHWFAKETNQRVEAARESIRRFINARAVSEIIFTRNATESINLVARAFPWKPGDVVLTTDKEHNSNLVPWQWVTRGQGVVHKVVPVGPDNTFDLNALERALAEPVRLVSFGHVSNLDGVLIPARQIIEMCHARGALVMLDAAQSVPHMKTDVQELGVDFLAASLHKLGGPSGMGILYARRELTDQMGTYIVGGDTIRDTFVDKPPLFLPSPHRYEAGLQDYAGMIASGAAIEYLETLDMEEIHAHEIELNQYLTRELSRFEELEILGPKDAAKRGGILVFVARKPGMGDIAEKLDERANIAVRAGMFCVNSWFNSHAINRNLTATRISLYLYNTLDECRTFARTLEEILADPIYEGLPLLPVKKMSNQIIIQRFRKLFTEKSPYLGRLDGATTCADAMACRGSKDHLFLYARIEQERVAEIKYECAMCDPEMLVTGEILCRLAHGKALSDLAGVDKAAFSADLGFQADDMLIHFEGARQVLDQVVEHYRLGKRCDM